MDQPRSNERGACANDGPTPVARARNDTRRVRCERLGRPPVGTHLDEIHAMSQARTRHAIRNRLVLSMAASVALGLSMTAVVFAVGTATIKSLADQTVTMNTIDEAAHTLRASLPTQETFAFEYALSLRPEALEEFEAAAAGEAKAYSDFVGLAGAYPDLLASAGAAHVATSAWREQWALPYVRSVAANRTLDGVTAVAAGELLFAPAEEALEVLETRLAIERAATDAQIEAAIPELATVLVPLGVGTTVLLALLGMWLIRSISGPLMRLNRTAEALAAGEAVTFRPERDDELGALAEVLERLRVDVGARYELARLEGERAATFNQLAELTSFARDEAELVQAASWAVRRLVPTTGGDILLANPSQNRLTVGAAWGDGAPEPGALVSLDRIDRCPGIRRSSAFVVADVADDLAVRCPAQASAAGAVVCLPMLALGKIVGVIHLVSTADEAFTSTRSGS